MDLKTGKLFWPETYKEKIQYEALNENIECDVVIVGGGMSGAITSYFLNKANLNTVVVEKNEIAGGSSSANTGLLQFSSDKALFENIQSFGEEAAVTHYQLSQDAVKQLTNEIIPKLPFNPDFIPRKSFYYASTEEDIEMIENEYKALKKHGFPVERLSKDDMKEVGHFPLTDAILTGSDAEVNPYKMANALIEYVVSKGVRVFEQTKVHGRKDVEDGVILYTDHEFEIKTKHVIYAQGYEAQERATDPNSVIDSSYAIATNQLKNRPFWKDEMMIWETARPYYYARTTADGRIVIGGLDETITLTEKRDSKLLHKSEQLIAKLEEWFPHLAGKVEAEYLWTAYFGDTHDGLPMIGRYERFPNSYFLLGYGGNGTIYSLVLGSLIADHILGKESEAFDLYMKHPIG